MKHHLITAIVVKLLIPFILLFALYVQFHGDFGPGGGFQAGVIFAVAFILYAMLYGLDHAERIIPPEWVAIGIAGGLIIFVSVGFIGMFLGGNYLDYNVLAQDPVHGQHRGILWVEVGVGITVSAVMIKIFYMFAGWGRE